MSGDDEVKITDEEPAPEPEGEPPGPTVAKAHDASSDTPEEVLLSRLESLIFVFPEPITVRRMARALSLKGKYVRELLAKLVEHYRDRGIVLEEVSGGFHFHTHPDNAPVVRHALKAKPLRVSRAALETLAIVAYRQPATRAEIEDVRRVDCGSTLRFLFEKGLIRVLGRKEEPGRPVIYGTSPTFLELFGLKSLDDLPSLREFTELWDEHQELVDELEDEAGPDPGAEQEPEPEQEDPEPEQEEPEPEQEEPEQEEPGPEQES